MSNRPIKILVADDEDVIREIMARKIASQDYEVITAKDGQEAWSKIVSDFPDIIILDLNMPHMDGWSVLKKLRLNPPVKGGNQSLLSQLMTKWKVTRKPLIWELIIIYQSLAKPKTFLKRYA